MHMKNPLLFGLMAILLLGGTITPVLGQSDPETKIIINEIELNPTGSDAGYGTGGTGINSKTSDGSSGGMEFVELYNPTSNDIDVGGWSLVPSAAWKAYVIPENTIIESQGFAAFTYVNFWFKDFGDYVSLYDPDGNLVDETPLLKDQDDDATSWQRITDGQDTDDISDWELKRVTPKSSNGVITETLATEFTLTGSTDKTNYVLGEYVTISGTVSEKLFTEKPYFTAEIIKISVTGPSFYKNIALFPERSLDYSTTLNMQEVYGFKTGDYDVSINYGGNLITTSFSIGETLTSTSSEVITETVELFTDKDSYIPGETLILSADTNSSIEYGGLYYTIFDPNGDELHAGTIFPNTEFSVVHEAGGGQLFPFSTQILMSAINPIYGTYEVTGIYKSQDSITDKSDKEIMGKTSFILTEDVKEDVPISLYLDKEVYTVDDTIKITGRSNDVWTEDLALRITQTSVLSSNSVGSDARYVAPDPFDFSDSVRLNGDGTFEYEFKVISANSDKNDYAYALGDYRVEVSEYFGNSYVSFKIVEDPDNFSDVRTPLGLKTDASEYVLGTKFKMNGSILNYDYNFTNNLRNTVEVTFYDENNSPISFIDHQGSSDATNCNTNDCEQYSKPLVYRVMPDQIGSFDMEVVLSLNQFDYGKYTAKVYHPASKTTESVQFDIVSAQKELLPVEDVNPPLTLHFEKDVYYVGEKLDITGTVVLKDPTSLDQSSTKPSGSTQTGHSYTTNYAHAIQNYIEVSIPYPKSMTIVPSGNYKTIPNEDENFTGGGGSGGGGVADGTGTSGIGAKNKNFVVTDKQSTGYDGQKILQRTTKLLTDMNFKAYPDENGNYKGMFDLRAGIFGSGTYLVKANYFGHYTEKTVTIIDNSLKGGLKPQINIELDKTVYSPGDTVRISGLIENIYYFDSVSIIIETPSDSEANCFSGQQCGFANSERKLRVQETVDGPKFFMNYKIPADSSTIGKYSIIVDTHFGEAQKQFFVIEKSDVIDTSNSPSKIIEKFNRISDNEIPITLTEKSSDENTLVPRVIQGSLFTSARGEESNVNLRLTTVDGQCVIGQSSDCLVSESTRKPGEIYSIVSIDDVNYKIRYSGNDVRLEKFSIVPEESNSPINIDNWKVEVIKDEQPSRFYYKVSYVALE